MSADSDYLLRRFLLALCAYREGRGESSYGKLLICQVVENRVVDTRWPDKYEDVILQPKQFSAFNPDDVNVTRFPRQSDPAWPDCVAAADFVLTAAKPLTDANHYCHKSIRPSWYVDSKVVIREGNHIFLTL